MDRDTKLSILLSIIILAIWLFLWGIFPLVVRWIQPQPPDPVVMSWEFRDVGDKYVAYVQVHNRGGSGKVEIEAGCWYTSYELPERRVVHNSIVVDMPAGSTQLYQIIVPKYGYNPEFFVHAYKYGG
jgi:hypothetical protein